MRHARLHRTGGLSLRKGGCAKRHLQLWSGIVADGCRQSIAAVHRALAKRRGEFLASYLRAADRKSRATGEGSAGTGDRALYSTRTIRTVRQLYAVALGLGADLGGEDGQRVRRSRTGREE